MPLLPCLPLCPFICPASWSLFWASLGCRCRLVSQACLPSWFPFWAALGCRCRLVPLHLSSNLVSALCCRCRLVSQACSLEMLSGVYAGVILFGLVWFGLGSRFRSVCFGLVGWLCLAWLGLAWLLSEIFVCRVFWVWCLGLFCGLVLFLGRFALLTLQLCTVSYPFSLSSLYHRCRRGLHVPGSLPNVEKMVWLGLVWFGLVWFGLSWVGLAWFGFIWLGLAWFGFVWLCLAWFGLVWVGLAWLGLLGFLGLLGVEPDKYLSGFKFSVQEMRTKDKWRPDRWNLVGRTIWGLLLMENSFESIETWRVAAKHVTICTK